MTDPASIVRRYYELFNERRFDEAAELIAPEAAFEHRPTKERLIGPAGYRAFAHGWIRAFPDAYAEVTNIAVEDGRRVIADFTGQGTHSGTFDVGDARFPPTDRILELHFRQIFTVQAGRIVESVLDFDLAEMRRLLGQSRG